MSTWTFGPIKCDEDWGYEYKPVEYKLEYGTCSDYLTIFKKSENEDWKVMCTFDYEGSRSVAKLMTQFLVNYVNKDIVKEILDKK